ncbi:MAG: hypothetical protein RIG84_15615 [Roseovarius sp.]
MPEPAEQAVAILMPDVKPGLRLGRVPLDRLRWPLGRPARLMRGTVADLGPKDHLIGFPQNLFLLRPGLGTRARVSILMAEPAAIHRAYHRKVARIARRFHRVLSYDEALLARLPNGVFFPYGSTWVPGWRDLDLTKSAMCSLIASSKRSQEGHQLRHGIAEAARREGLDVAVMGQGYRPFGEKSEGLAPFRYSVVIENVRERNCFTEKLIDALLCRTVPIYWGCPNIGDFMDPSGMILCETEAEIRAALRTMSEADYAARLPGLEAALPMAEAYSDIFARAARAVLTGEPVPQLSI